MASPLADGLFQRAILQSGVCVDGPVPLLKNAEADGERVVKDLGVAENCRHLAGFVRSQRNNSCALRHEKKTLILIR